MKKIISIITIIIFTSILNLSCEDFIEVKPVSTVSIDVLYKTDKDFQDAVVGCYNMLQIQYLNHWIIGDLRGDDSKHEIFSNIALLTVDNFALTNDAALVGDSWLNYYTLINRVNTLIAKSVNTDPAVIINKDRHIAEAKFLRALSYFDLVRIFGDVPLITSIITIEEGYRQKREKAEKIYDDLIIKDLQEIESILPEKYTGNNVGRATKGAASALLGKVYLTRQDFTNAEAKLKEVTSMGYALLPDFKALFDYTKDEHHSEYIFDIEYEEGGIGLGNNFTNRFIPNSVAMASYYKVTGSRGESNSAGDGLFTIFASEDTRKDITIGIKGGFYDVNGKFIALLPTTSQSYTKKYLLPVAVANDSKANWKVIRYADVLLMYAEALNENNKTAEALGYLNMIRKRANVPEYSNLTKDETREMIYLERRLELAFEGHRWFDLVRTGRALSVMEPYGMKPYMTVFPIPLSQIQLINDPVLFPQNPGYE